MLVYVCVVLIMKESALFRGCRYGTYMSIYSGFTYNLMFFNGIGTRRSISIATSIGGSPL